MVEVITIDDYKQVIKNTDINNISDESIQTAINITTLTLDSVCGSNISKRWPLDETNRLHLTIEQKEYIRNAFILQTKYVLDNNIDFSVGTDQSTNGSSSWSQTRLKREQILPEVYELLQTAGVYYTNAFISSSYGNADKPKCTCPNDFYCPGEKSTPIDLEIGDNRYIKQYNPNARRKWLFSDERGLITYTSTNPERWVLDCIINGETVVDPLTNIASFEMIKDILDENGNSLVDPATHTVTLGEWLKVDLSNNPNNFTNGIQTYIYQDNRWWLNGVHEGSTTGAPIKLAYHGYGNLMVGDDKYRCLTFKPNDDKIFEFQFNNLGMWNTISTAAIKSLNITGNDSNTDLITKDINLSENNNPITFNIAPNQIFERNKGLIKDFVMEHLTYGVNNSTFTTIDQNNAGYYLTHLGGDTDTKCWVAPSDGTLKFKFYGNGANGQAWAMYDINGYNGVHYNFPAGFGDALVTTQVRQGDKVYLKGYDLLTWNYIRFFPNEWRYK